MARTLKTFGSALALAAALSLTATPAMARDRWHHRDRGIDAGDVIAGVLIIGGIAAIASAASNSDRDRRDRDYDYERDYRDRDYDYRNDGYDYRRESQGRYPATSGYRSGGIDNAVDMCVGEVERGEERVASVDNASRTGDGWRISGRLGAGGGFSCWIDNDGRIRNIELGGGYYDSSYNGSDDRQWSDDAYAEARARSREPAPYAASDEFDYAYRDIEEDRADSGY
ncbi:MAG TPA: hypothetical protein VLA37_01870 [Sphingomonadaceae bacterium]|nr:hypothetical protein [Sphingomonadaceae bacterium]